MSTRQCVERQDLIEISFEDAYSTRRQDRVQSSPEITIKDTDHGSHSYQSSSRQRRAMSYRVVDQIPS